MALDAAFPYTVGLLLGDVEKSGGVDHDPVGTFFLLGIPHGRTLNGMDVFMVTARHVIDRHPNIEALIRDVGGEPTKPWPVTDWAMPDDETFDIAVSRWDYPEDEQPTYMVLPSPESYEELRIENSSPMAGVSVYFAGLLAPLRNLAMRGVPVVRTAAVSVWDAPDVVWFDPRMRGEVAPRKKRRANRAHLIDTRSYGGFSGGPAFVQFTIPGPRQKTMPEAWAIRTRAAGNDPNLMGDMHSMTMWCGMFAAFIEDSGIGVVVRSEDIMEFIETSPEVRAMRERNREDDEQRDAEEGPVSQAVTKTEAEYQRQDYLDDLRAVTRKLDSESLDSEA